MSRGRQLLGRKRKYHPLPASNSNNSITDGSSHDFGQTRTSSRQSVCLRCKCGMIFYGQNRRNTMLRHCLDINSPLNCKSMVEKCVHCNTDVLMTDGGYKQHIANSAYCKMKTKELERVQKVIGNYATTGVRICQNTAEETHSTIGTNYAKNEIIYPKVHLVK